MLLFCLFWPSLVFLALSEIVATLQMVQLSVCVCVCWKVLIVGLKMKTISILLTLEGISCQNSAFSVNFDPSSPLRSGKLHNKLNSLQLGNGPTRGRSLRQSSAGIPCTREWKQCNTKLSLFQLSPRFFSVLINSCLLQRKN